MTSTDLFKRMVTMGLYNPNGTPTQAFMCNTITCFLGSSNSDRHHHLAEIQTFMNELRDGKTSNSQTLFNCLVDHLAIKRGCDRLSMKYRVDQIDEACVSIYKDWDNRWQHVEDLLQLHIKTFPRG